MAKATAPKKRIGRPTKKPKPGERVPLGLRITPRMKSKLEEAATKKGRSLSQEVEMRLEMSLSADYQLILAYGGHWLSVIRASGDAPGKGGLAVALPIGWEDDQIEDDLVFLQIDQDGLERIRNFFRGAPPPYNRSKAEIEAAGEGWVHELADQIKRDNE